MAYEGQEFQNAMQQKRAPEAGRAGEDEGLIDPRELKRSCYYLFKIDGGTRAYLWKCFLNYFPRRHCEWKGFLAQRRELYGAYLEHAERTRAENQGNIAHIRCDLQRTSIHPLEGARGCSFLDARYAGGTHRDALFRVLLVYSVTNSSIGYIQGMNIVAAVIYYTMATSPDRDSAWAEADSYFCFFNLMAEIGDGFSARMDHDSEIGVYGKMRRTIKILRREDRELYRSMKRAGVLANSMFHFKWISLLVANEFAIEDTQRIWDKFLSEQRRFRLLPFFCAAMIISVRSRLVGRSFEECMEVLQGYSGPSVDKLFYMAHTMGQDEE